MKLPSGLGLDLVAGEAVPTGELVLANAPLCTGGAPAALLGSGAITCGDEAVNPVLVAVSMVAFAFGAPGPASDAAPMAAADGGEMMDEAADVLGSEPAE